MCATKETQQLASVGTDGVEYYMYIGVGDGWQRGCKTCQSRRELDNQATVYYCFWWSP